MSIDSIAVLVDLRHAIAFVGGVSVTASRNPPGAIGRRDARENLVYLCLASA